MQVQYELYLGTANIKYDKNWELEGCVDVALEGWVGVALEGWVGVSSRCPPSLDHVPI